MSILKYFIYSFNNDLEYFILITEMEFVTTIKIGKNFEEIIESCDDQTLQRGFLDVSNCSV